MTYGTAHFRYDPFTPLSEIAYLNRQAVNQAMKPEEVDIGLAVMREMVKRKQNMHTCEPFEKSYSVTNWCGAWKDLDFQPAVEKREKEGKESQKLDMFIVGHGGELKTPRRCKLHSFRPASTTRLTRVQSILQSCSRRGTVTGSTLEHLRRA